MNRKNHEEIQPEMPKKCRGARSHSEHGPGSRQAMYLMQAFVQEVGLALLELVRGVPITSAL